MRLKILAGCALAFVMSSAASATVTVTMSGTASYNGLSGTGNTFTATLTYDDTAPRTGTTSYNNTSEYGFYSQGIASMTFVSGSYNLSLTSLDQEIDVYNSFNSNSNDLINGFVQDDYSGAYLQVQFQGAYTSLNSAFMVDPSVAFATSIANSNLNQFYAYDGSNYYFGTITSATSSASAVPEPASWLMMIGGFGLIGAAMRRQRKVAVSFG